MTAPRRFGIFATAFAILYPIIYLGAFEFNLAAFTYHPAIGAIAWGADRPRDAPAMYWYGWIATAAICSLVIAVVAAYLPDSISQKLPAALAWLVPLFALVTVGGLMVHTYFFR